MTAQQSDSVAGQAPLGLRLARSPQFIHKPRVPSDERSRSLSRKLAQPGTEIAQDKPCAPIRRMRAARQRIESKPPGGTLLQVEIEHSNQWPQRREYGDERQYRTI